MPAPTTIDEFLDVARKSGVVDEKRLAAHMAKLTAAGPLPATTVQIAQKLVEDGLLTHFQADQFLQGKWRRFTIGKYKVLERLGAGGMGSVYLCEHIMMRRRVAVKVLPTSKAADTSSLERFYREARAVAALDHPNIVRAYDIDQEENLHFLVMEHVDGSSMQEMIKRAGKMDVLRAAHYIRQAALGLQHAHETAGLVHRDIKPGNILVDRNGIVKVLDMGLARFFHDEEDQITRNNDENVLGTADYLAPEQALDSHSVDIRADLYSLGGTFYFCLTGRTPFAEGTVAQKLIWHQTRQPKPIRAQRPEVPEGIVAIIDRMMAKSPDSRYQTPQEVADALAPWTQTPIPPPPEKEMPQFSLAAAPRSMTGGEAGMSSSSRTTDAGAPPSPPPRRTWQVTGAPSPPPTAAAPATVAAPPRATPAPPARPAPAPIARAAPVASVNGTVAPTMELPAATPRPRQEVQATIPRAVAAPAVETPTEHLPVFESGGAAAAAARRRGSATRKAKEKRSILPIVLGAAGLLVLLLAGGLVLLLSMLGNWSDRNKQGRHAREPIVVGVGGVAAALRKAKTGDRIILDGNVAEGEISVRQSQLNDITIEGAEGRSVVWKSPDCKVEDNRKLLYIEGATNVTIRNITFDGDNKATVLLLAYARCSNLKLENVRFQNSARYGVLFTNCELAGADKKIAFERVNFDGPNMTGVHFMIPANSRSLLQNRYVDLRGCQFGNVAKPVTAEEGSVDPATIQMPAGLTLLTVPKPAPKKQP